MKRTKTSLFGKSSLIKFVMSFAIILFVGCGAYFVSLAASEGKQAYTFSLADYMKFKFSTIHFNVGGNDLGGGLFLYDVDFSKESNLPKPVTIATTVYTGGTTIYTGGTIIYSGGVEIYTGGTEVYVGGTTTTEYRLCDIQLRGFYYNSARGNRLWPLDEDSKKVLIDADELLVGKGKSLYRNVDIDGGLYTKCKVILQEGGKVVGTGSVENPSVYGLVEHKYADADFYLAAGMSYNPRENRLLTMNNGLKCNFELLGTVAPFGYIYDNYGGMGVVGAMISQDGMLRPDVVSNFHAQLNNGLNNTQCVSDYFEYDKVTGVITDNKTNPIVNSDFPEGAIGSSFLIPDNGGTSLSFFKFGIRGLVGLTNEVEEEWKEMLETNAIQSSVLYRTDSSVSSVINGVSKKSEQLCRNKWSSSTSWSTNNIKGVYCYQGNGGTVNARPSLLAGKTIIMKNASLRLVYNAASPNNYTDPINLFIDKGNLYIAESSDTSKLLSFNDEGYSIPRSNCGSFSYSEMDEEGEVTNYSIPGCSLANYLKGNFIINGLLLGETPDDTGVYSVSKIRHKLYVHGKFISYNSLETASDKRGETVAKILGLNDIGTIKDYISLYYLFDWRCEPTRGVGTDNTWCNQTTWDQNGNSVVTKAFALIDVDYDSPFF